MIGLLLLCASAAIASPAIELPVSFEPNMGQTDTKVQYLAHGEQATVWFTRDAVVLGVARKQGTAILKMRFDGGKKSPAIVAQDPLGGASNYFVGRDPAKWRTGVPHFGKVRYRDVYPGIDVVFHGDAHRIEYDFDVAPGADPSRIRLAFDGIDRLRQESGDLVLEVGGVEIRHRRPAIFQDGKRVAGRYVLLGRNRAGFEIDRYNANKPLLIDPVLTYASLLGGSAGDQANGVTLDAQGNVYVTGTTNSSNFPSKNGYQPAKTATPGWPIPTTNVFLTKINPSASGAASIVYSTFYGGDNFTLGGAVAVDKNGNAYITGNTSSVALPLKNAFVTTLLGGTSCNGSDATSVGSTYCLQAFVAEISASGSQLVYSSYLGGSTYDSGSAITVDAGGNAWVAGETQSIDFQQRGTPIQTQLKGNSDGFVSEISPAGNLIYSTFFGGEGNDSVNAIAVDASGSVYIGGQTNSTQLLTTPGAYQSHYPGAGSGFVAKLNPSLGGLASVLYCTYLGGSSGGSSVSGIAVDGSGNIYAAGPTNSSTFPVTANGARTQFADFLGLALAGDGFAVKLTPSAQGNAQLAYSTFVGGSFDDQVNGIAVDAAGRITVTGVTNSFDFPTSSDAFQCCYSGGVINGFLSEYGFISRFDPSRTGTASLIYSTLLGGTLQTIPVAIAMDSTGNTVAIAGTVEGTNTPVTPSAYQSQYGGDFITTEVHSQDYGDAYIARFDFSQSAGTISNLENGAGLSAIKQVNLSPGLIFTIKGSGLGPATGVGPQLDPASGLVSNNVSGVQVLVDNVAVPLLYVSATQINAVAPYELASKAGGYVSVQPVYNGVAGALLFGSVAATAPAIFSFADGSGQGAIRNQDQSINGPNNPASVGSIVSIYATGEGAITPPLPDGTLANDYNNLPKPNAKVSVTIGGIAVTNMPYAGTAPGGIAGFLQVNVAVPAGVTPGPSVPVVLTIGTVSSPAGLTMAIQ